MKFVTYNIQYSLGKDGVYDVSRIVDAVRGADIIALQEVVRNFSGAPDPDQPAKIAALLPDYYWTYGAPVDIDKSARNPDGSITNRRFQFGNMLLSRWPIRFSRLLLLPRRYTYDKMNLQCGALEGVIDCPTGSLRVYSIHLNYLNSAERMAQIEYLLPKLLATPQEGAAASGAERPWPELQEVEVPDNFVVMGDFNLTSDSAEYARIVGESDYYYGRRLVPEHWVDSWVQAGHAEDTGATWFVDSAHSDSGLRLDYGFVNAGLATKVKQAWIDNEAIGSDHQPTWFELND